MDNQSKAINPRKKYRREYYLKNKAKNYRQSREWIKSNKVRYKEVRREWVKRFRLEKKMEALDYYGRSCKCCNESIVEFLSVDHINGGGTAHRKAIKRSDLWIWLCEQGFPEGYQILCFNCNLAKGFFGICPHKKYGLPN